jgi:hypothetical protein
VADDTHKPAGGSAPALRGGASLLERVDSAIELLESIREGRAQLSELDEGRRVRLLQAAGQVARPDPWTKRERFRAARQKREAERRAADERALSQAGIREQRRAAVFATPPLFAPPPVPAGADIDRTLALTSPDLTDAPRVSEPRACYICMTRFQELHFF